MASITWYETKNGKRYRVQYTGPDGVRRTKRGFRTKAQAETWMIDNAHRINNGQWISPEKQGTKLNEIWTRYEKKKKRKGLKASSLAQLESTWRVHVEPKWGSHKLETIKTVHIQDWIDSIEQDSVAIRCKSLMFNLYEEAMRFGLTMSNPCLLVESPAKPSKKQYVMSPEQVKAFMDTTTRFKSLIAFIAFSGCRWGEATALTVGDVDKATGKVSIGRAVVRINKKIVFDTPKNRRNRVVVVPLSVIELMLPDMKDKLPSALVWTNRDGTPVSVPSRRSWFHSALDKCKKEDPTFPDMTPHDFRHFAASAILSGGGSIMMAQNQLGHASARVTLDVYSHMMPEDHSTLQTRLTDLASRIVKSESKDTGS